MLLHDAMRTLRKAANNAGYAITQGFLARLLERRGDLESALVSYQEADIRLRIIGDHRLELYNLIPWSRALSRSGRVLYSRAIALRALRRSQCYGAGHKHRNASLALLLGGAKLYDRLRVTN